MTTTNLGLNIALGADKVNPVEAFTRNFETIDKLGVDYVTKTGTSGEWWYRIWKSGRAECGIDTKTFETKTSVGWGSMWLADNFSFGVNYPLTFSAPPFVTVLFRYEQNGYGGIVHIKPASSESKLTTTPPEFAVADANGPHTYTNPKFGIYATGVFKEMAEASA